MKITDIKIIQVDGDEKLKAYVTMKLDDCFIVRDVKVISGTNGYFIAMPAKKMKDGTYRDLVHPVDKDTRLMMEEKIMAEFSQAAKTGSASGSAPMPATEQRKIYAI